MRAAVEQDAALGRRLEPRDAAQGRGLAAAARPEQRDELAGRDAERQRAHHRLGRVALYEIADFELGGGARFLCGWRQRHVCAAPNCGCMAQRSGCMFVKSWRRCRHDERTSNCMPCQGCSVATCLRAHRSLRASLPTDATAYGGHMKAHRPTIMGTRHMVAGLPVSRGRSRLPHPGRGRQRDRRGRGRRHRARCRAAGICELRGRGTDHGLLRCRGPRRHGSGPRHMAEGDRARLFPKAPRRQDPERRVAHGSTGCTRCLDHGARRAGAR